MKKDVSEYDAYLLGLGEERGVKIGEERGVKIGEERGVKIGEERGVKIGEERGVKIGEEKGRIHTVQKYIWNRWKEHVTKAQILKDLKSYFDLEEKEARKYMKILKVKA